MSDSLAAAAQRRTPRRVAAETARSVGRLFGIVLGVTLLLSLAVCYWAGLFDPVTLSEQRAGPWNIVYRTHQGPYEGLRFAIRDVARYTEAATGARPQVGFAVFLDDAASMDAKTLRSIAGCLLDSVIAQPDTFYVSGRVEAFDAVVGTFRLRSFFSYMMGVFKFYPALDDYLRERQLELAGPVVELYDMRQRQIRYVAPLDRAPFLPDTLKLPLLLEE